MEVNFNFRNFFIWKIYFFTFIRFVDEQNGTCKEYDVECLPIRNCTEYMDFINAHRPLNHHIVTFLRKKQCGFYREEPKVCCSEIPKEQRLLMAGDDEINNLSVKDRRSVRTHRTYFRARHFDKSEYQLPPVHKLLMPPEKLGLSIDRNHIELRWKKFKLYTCWQLWMSLFW